MARRLAAAALALALCFALPPAVIAQDSPAIGQQADSNPVWLERPRAEAFVRFYPEAALHQSIVGRVLLDCSIGLDASADCSPVRETPIGWGFGEAAVAISHTFQFAPAVREGRPVAGARVRVPISFRYDEIRNPASISRMPTWEDAPTFVDVMMAYPAEALQRGVRGRAVLSCIVVPDRTLVCGVESERPSGYRFGTAALQLARRFRLAARQARSDVGAVGSMLRLPINFGAGPLDEPLNRFSFVEGVIDTDPPPAAFVAPFYPERARTAGISGVAVLKCTVSMDAPLECIVESETPQGHGFAEAALAMTANYDPELAFLLDGREVRISVPFGQPENRARDPR